MIMFTHYLTSFVERPLKSACFDAIFKQVIISLKVLYNKFCMVQNWSTCCDRTFFPPKMYSCCATGGSLGFFLFAKISSNFVFD